MSEADVNIFVSEIFLFRKGKAVNIKHFYGDQLWAAGTREQLPDLGPPDLDFPVEDQSGDEDLKDSEGDNEAAAEENNDIADSITEDKSELLNEVSEQMEEMKIDQVECDTEQAEVEEDTRSPQEVMNDLLDQSLLQSLKTTFSSKKSEFPILTSNFYRLHMVPACPPQLQLDIKKSSYKKLSKYLESKQKAGLLKIKELQKGVESIVSVDYDHDMIRSYRVVKYEQIPNNDKDANNDANICDNKYEPPVIVELFAVTANVLKLFKTADIGKGTGLTVQEVRQILTNYVKDNDLKSEVGGFVKLDPLLGDLVPGKSDKASWEELQQCILSKMSPGYSLKFGDKPAQVSLHI